MLAASYEVYLSHLFIVLPGALLWGSFGSSVLIPIFYPSVVLSCALLGELLARAYAKPLKQRLSASTWLGLAVKLGIQ